MKIFSCKYPAWMGLTLLVYLMLAVPFSLHGLSDADASDPDPSGPAVEKIHITAQRLISDTANSNAEFSGDVIAKQGDTLITADSLKIFFSRESNGSGASPAQSMEKLVATGNVEIKFDNRLAVARQAVYITAQRVLILSGPGATVTSGDNIISGETITFYREDGRFTVDGGTNGRVKAVILPEESGLE